MYAHFSAQAYVAERIEQARSEHRTIVADLRGQLTATRSELRLLRSDLDHHVVQQERDIANLTARTTEVRSSIDSHSQSGIGGLPHPAGVVAQLKEIERDLAMLGQSTDDRWQAKDMRAWVKLLAAQNASLNVPPLNGDGH